MPTDLYRILRLKLALLPGLACLMAPALAAPPPAAPARLRATPGDRSVALAWAPVPGADAYRVLFAPVPGGPYAPAAQVKATRYVARGLTNWATHYYVVAAVRAGHAGTPSAEAEGTPEGPPAAPTGLRAKPGHTQVSLVWAAVPGADGYDVYRAAGADVTADVTKAVASGIDRCVWTDAGLTDGAVYRYRVVAVISAAHRAALTGRTLPAGARSLAGPAAPAVAATPSAALPLAPASVSASAGEGLVTLAWEAGASDANEAKPATQLPSKSGTTYRVYRGMRSGGEGTVPWKEGLAAAPLSSADVRNGTTYYYLVTAVTAAGESAYSPERSATPSGASAGPGLAVASALPDTPGGLGSVGAGGLANGLGGSAGGVGGASAAPARTAPTPATGGSSPSGGGSASPTPPVGGLPPVSGQPIPGPPAGPPVSAPTPGPPPISTPTPPNPVPPSPTPPPVTGGGGGGGLRGGGGGGSTGSSGPTAPGSPGGDLPSPPAGSDPAFYLTLSGSQLGLRTGGPVTVTLTFVSQQGLLGPIRPSVSGLPAGATAMFYPADPALTAVVDGQSVASTTLYLFGPAAPLPVGPYSVTVAATLGSPPSPQASGALTVYGG